MTRAARLSPEFIAAADLWMVETSRPLRALQAELAAIEAESIGWLPLGDGAYLHVGDPQALVITVTGSFQVFDTVAVTTRGGPVNVTRVFQYYIYQKAFGEGQFGYGSALSVILFLILGVLAALQLRLLRSGESDLA